MSVPAVTEVDTRDGSSNKYERLTNMRAKKYGELMACIRPGLNTMLTASGNGNGLMCFNGQIMHVFGTALKFGTTPTSISTVLDGPYDFAVLP